MPAIGELVVGKYRVEGQLGSGGMGVVLKARHETIGQRVAIKFLVVNDEDRRAEAAERLLREARAVAALRGEHVVRIYDVGEYGSGAPFIVMEYLEGADLGAVVRSIGRLSVADAALFVVQASRAVSEAHGAGIVHRDLKPTNLFVARLPEGSARIKVLDFGIAKSLSSELEATSLTGERTALGTPYYMSPEQVRDSHAVDRRSDVWSLGAILYELVAGRPAFQAATQSGVYAAIVADAPPPLSSLRSDVPRALEQVLARCLERDVRRRFQNADELAAALTPFAAREVDFDVLLRARLEVALQVDSRTEHPITATESGPRRAPGDDSHVRTQVSPGAAEKVDSGARQVLVRSTPLSGSAVPTERSPVTRVHRTRSLLRRGVVGAFLCVLFGAGVWALVHRQSDSLPAAPTLTELTIRSRPPGARVMEGATLRGRTPLTLSLPSLASGEPARHFALELPGYERYELEQPARSGKLTVDAALVHGADSAPALTATATASPSAEPRPSVVANGRLSRKPAPHAGAPPSASAPVEIRLKR